MIVTIWRLTVGTEAISTKVTKDVSGRDRECRCNAVIVSQLKSILAYFEVLG